MFVSVRVCSRLSAACTKDKTDSACSAELGFCKYTIAENSETSKSRTESDQRDEQHKASHYQANFFVRLQSAFYVKLRVPSGASPRWIKAPATSATSNVRLDPFRPSVLVNVAAAGVVSSAVLRLLGCARRSVPHATRPQGPYGGWSEHAHGGDGPGAIRQGATRRPRSGRRSRRTSPGTWPESRLGTTPSTPSPSQSQAGHGGVPGPPLGPSDPWTRRAADSRHEPPGSS